MRRLKTLAAAVLMAAVALAACFEGTGPDPTGPMLSGVMSSLTLIDNTSSVDLIADGGDEYLDIGDVTVSNDGTNISVEYQIIDPASDDWCIVQVHTHVGPALTDFPLTNNGNPKVGQFAYPDPAVIYDPLVECKKSVTVEVPITGSWWNGPLLIAAHAVVVNLNETEGVELVANGSFEAPVVGTSENWDIFEDGTTGLGWSVEWTAAVPEMWNSHPRPTSGWLEIQKSGVVVSAYDGGQYAELDTDWSGPPSSVKPPFLSAFNGEPAPVKIYQDLDACPSGLYEIEYAYQRRESGDRMSVSLDGASVATHEPGSDGWNAESTVESAASEGTVRLAFEETGAANSLGMFLDAVSVECIREETAWGEGNRFVEPGNWAMYFEYTLNECPQVTEYSYVPTADGGILQLLGTPLTDVRAGQDPSEHARVFQEYVGDDHAGFKLDINHLNATNAVLPPGDGFLVAAGTGVCSYYVHFDDGDYTQPVYDVLWASLTFEADIMGLIVAGTINASDIFYQKGINTLCDTDGALGAIGTTYEATASCGINGDARGLEIFNANPTLPSNQDPVNISGPNITFNPLIANKHDSFRIILPAYYVDSGS